MGLSDDTLIIRTADHGEMGLAHGGMRQKNFNFYEEATRVPLVYSNPKLYPRPLSTDALVSHVDFLPTLASLVAAPAGAAPTGRASTTRALVLRPKKASRCRTTSSSPTTTSSRARRAALPETAEPHRQHPRGALEDRQVLRRRPRNPKPPQWEMYDLKTDPQERTNLAYRRPQADRRCRSANSDASNGSSPGSKRPA